MKALDACHFFNFRQGDQPSQSGVGVVNQSLKGTVEEVVVLSRVAYLVLRIAEKYTFKVVQRGRNHLCHG